MSNTKDVYTLSREVAATQLGVSVRTLDRWLKTKKMRSRTAGRVVWVHAADVQKKMGNLRPRRASKASAKESVENGGSIYKKLYEEQHSELKQKQEKLEAAHFRVGQLEAQLQQSVPLLTAQKESDELKEKIHTAEKKQRSAELRMWAMALVAVLALSALGAALALS